MLEGRRVTGRETSETSETSESWRLILIRGLSSPLSAAAVGHIGVTAIINLNAQNH